MTVSTRPRKRQRTALPDEEEKTPCRPVTWDTAVAELLQRLNAIRTEAVALRDDHLRCADEIQQKISTRNTATKAASKVTQSQPTEDDDTNIFTRGIQADPQPVQTVLSRPPPVPPMKLLTESDPPEKIIHEQSIIARAQAINRKNAELARERLPKQPEAMRSKTYHDYYLDEAIWLATDFREERKWKIQVAKKLAKAVAQHCAQRAQREARLRQETEQRTIRVARSMARGVRKFWSQIGEIAQFKRSLVEKEKAAEDMKTQLDELLETTEAYSSEIAKNLRFNGRLVNPQIDETNVKQVNSGKPQTNTYSSKNPTRAHPSESLHDELDRSKDDTSYRQTLRSDSDIDQSPANGNEEHESISEASEENMDITMEGADDESTLIAAEAEEKRDPTEVHRLEAEAGMGLEELLRSQGIDPSTYLNENKLLKDSQSAESDSEAESSVDEQLLDDNSVDIDEAEDKKDPQEKTTLENDAIMDIDELLRSQGIDPAAYKADKTNYLSPSEQPSTNLDHSDNASVQPHKGKTNVEVSSSVQVPNGREENFDSQKTGTKQENDLHLNNSVSDKVRPPMISSKNDGDNQSSDKMDTQSVQPPNSDKNSSDQVSNEKGEKSETENEPEKPHQQSDELISAEKATESDIQHPAALLRGSLRSYQTAGMEWLISLYRQGLNGILADEMGLGKTIQTIALLAWLAINRGTWGPHLIVVPTSVMVNWEVEFKRWLPGFKVLTYFGSTKERKIKRQGWTKPNTFHVCITSYTLAVQDAVVLRRKKWVYLILDEAHNIKNFESQRWQTLLSFASERRLLITGTPLQNSVMELWSLMHFLMPNLFTSHSKFKDWFSQPIAEAADKQGEHNAAKLEIVSNLHRVLRPFILRRLKADVEKGLPPKFEHVVKCPLSKRQRQLYEDFMSRSDIRETLQSGDFFGVMNVLMQLRKVCNHPDLFEGRPIVSPFAMEAVFYPVPRLIMSAQVKDQNKEVNLDLLSLVEHPTETFNRRLHLHVPGQQLSSNLSACADISKQMVNICEALDGDSGFTDSANSQAHLRLSSSRRARIRHQALINSLRLRRQSLLDQDLVDAAAMTPASLVSALRFNGNVNDYVSPEMENLVWSLDQISERAHNASERFVCCLTKASAPVAELRYIGDDTMYAENRKYLQDLNRVTSSYRTMFRSFEVRSQMDIPSARLVQWDCGKLQALDLLLRQLRGRHSRVLIFTQMTKMLDVLESFLNLHTYRYLRLDGTTKTDDRQRVVHRFNTDRKIFCMILTTRAGGVGLNLTGADAVVFYDTDYNPAIDNQAQDRAHRIGQTKPVHIYRLVSEDTVEENVLRRANEKRSLESLVISKGEFTTQAIRDTEAQQPKDPTSGKPPEIVQKNTAKTLDPVNADVGQTTENPSTKDNAIPATYVESAFGTISGQRDDLDNSKERKALNEESGNTEQPEIGVDDYQKVSEKILLAEDEQERLAIDFAERERLENLAEFDESSPDDKEGSTNEKLSEKSQHDFSQLISSLQPIQRYALDLIERFERLHVPVASPINLENIVSGKESDSTLDDTVKHDTLSSKKASEDSENRQSSDEADEDGSDEAENDHLFYELDTTEQGQLSYLKVLTDADADIKIYLPLRDGGPEELKISDVVSGTAAAGLECAEDAAFFPHAYNRMSRTPFATRRQKERSIANIRKRKTEPNTKRLKENRQTPTSSANSNSSTQHERTMVIQSSGLHGKQGSLSDRSKSVRNQNDSSRTPNSIAQKRLRTEGNSKQKIGTVATSGTSSLDAFMACNTGLFRKATKKASRRFSVAGGKSLLGNSGNALPGDSYGKNDGWTKEEDEELIALAAEYNNNMLLVADMLTMDSRVSVGLRRTRGVRHCIDRLLNVLAKDSKTGPLVPKATSSDANVFRKHEDALGKTLEKSIQKPPSWMTVPTISNYIHPSQIKTLTDISSNGAFLPRKEVPTMNAVTDKIKAPLHHKSGLKPTETTAQAIHRLRFPFLKSPKDDPRLLQNRIGAPPPSRASGLNNLRPFHNRPAAGPSRSNSKSSRATTPRSTGLTVTPRPNNTKVVSSTQRQNVETTGRSTNENTEGKTQVQGITYSVARQGLLIANAKATAGQVGRGSQQTGQGSGRAGSSEKKVLSGRPSGVSRNQLGKTVQGAQALQASQGIRKVQSDATGPSNTFIKEKPASAANSRRSVGVPSSSSSDRSSALPQNSVAHSNGKSAIRDSTKVPPPNGIAATKATKAAADQIVTRDLKSHPVQPKASTVDTRIVPAPGLTPMITTKKPPLPPINTSVVRHKAVTPDKSLMTQGGNGKASDSRPASKKDGSQNEEKQDQDKDMKPKQPPDDDKSEPDKQNKKT